MDYGKIKLVFISLVFTLAGLLPGQVFSQHEFTWKDTCYTDTTKFLLNDPNGINTIEWDFGDPSTGADNISNQMNPTHKFSFSGVYYVKLTINGTEIIRHNVVINPTPIIGDVTATACKGITMTMITDTGNNMSHYLWNTGETTQSITFQLVKDTTFKVWNYDFKGCKKQATFRVKATKININFDINSLIQCITTNYFTFKPKADTINRPWLQFEWNFGDGNSSNLISPGHTYGSSAKFTVQLRVYPQDTSACEETLSREVNVITQVTPDFEFFVNRCQNSVRVFNLSAPALNYYWKFGNIEMGNHKDTIGYFKKKGSYDITLYTSRNTDCVDSLTKTVVIDEVDTMTFIPSAFSPNKDEVNDLFQMVGLDYICYKYTLFIFNRWGEMIFNSANSETPPFWDGLYNGTIVQPGVYYYLIKGKTFKRYGTLSVVY